MSFDLHVANKKLCGKSILRGGGEAGARVLRDGNVAELYGRLFDEGEAVEGDRSNGDVDLADDRIER